MVPLASFCVMIEDYSKRKNKIKGSSQQFYKRIQYHNTSLKIVNISPSQFANDRIDRKLPWRRRKRK